MFTHALKLAAVCTGGWVGTGGKKRLIQNTHPHSMSQSLISIRAALECELEQKPATSAGKAAPVARSLFL